MTVQHDSHDLYTRLDVLEREGVAIEWSTEDLMALMGWDQTRVYRACSDLRFRKRLEWEYPEGGGPRRYFLTELDA